MILEEAKRLRWKFSVHKEGLLLEVFPKTWRMRKFCLDDIKRSIVNVWNVIYMWYICDFTRGFFLHTFLGHSSIFPLEGILLKCCVEAYTHLEVTWWPHIWSIYVWFMEILLTDVGYFGTWRGSHALKTCLRTTYRHFTYLETLPGGGGIMEMTLWFDNVGCVHNEGLWLVACWGTWPTYIETLHFLSHMDHLEGLWRPHASSSDPSLGDFTTSYADVDNVPLP